MKKIMSILQIWQRCTSFGPESKAIDFGSLPNSESVNMWIQKSLQGTILFYERPEVCSP